MKNTLETLQYNKLKELINKYLQTKYGEIALKNLNPIFDFNKVKRNYSNMLKFFEFFTKWGNIILDDIFINDIIEFSFRSMLHEKELKKVGDFIAQLINIKDEISRNDNEFYKEFIDFDIPYQLHEEITRSIDNYGFLKDTATDYLFRVREEKKELQYKINKTLKNLMHGRLNDILMDTTVFLKRSRYTLLLKPNYKEYINGRVVDIGRSGGFFVEPDSVFELNSTLEELISKEEAERRKILSRLTNMIRENVPRLKNNERKIGFLDLNIAKFNYAKSIPECEIEFKEEPILFAKNAKHAILASIKDDTKAVDIDLKSNTKLIITGPNTGGKTVFLKTIGLLVLSIYSAIPPFADRIEIGSIDNLFVIIGDQQDIFESLSGFSAKITAFKQSFDKATKNSIMLLDEIGSGTSPDEGEAIAYAIIKEVAKKCIVCATTHYKKLAYILKSENFMVAAFEFNAKTLRPTYKLTYGKIGKSYGIDIIKTLNLHKNIINSAETFYRNSSSLFSKLESKLEKNIEQYMKKKEELERLKIEYSNIIKEEEKEKRELLEKLNKEAEEKKEKFEKLIKELNSEIASLLKEKNVSKAHRAINRIKTEGNKLFIQKEEKIRKTNLQTGDKIEFNGMKGTIVNIKNEKATVEINGKLITTDTKALNKTFEVENKKEIKVNKPIKMKSLELNIIGKRSDEAYFELIKFIDALSIESIKKARIVHGHGNGVLKNMVRETLKNISLVKKFYPAPPQEGGDGATIVELN